MAKALLLNALHDALSDYVVGLSPERLKVGVWSGKIVLEELQVNPEAVNQLRLPVNIIHGTVKKLEVEIPWTKLGSRPVKVLLEGVCVLVGPVDRNSWGVDEVRERRLGIKRASLERAEAAAAAAAKKKKEEGGSGADDAVQQGFVEKLVQRVVDNIEINVADIHIRYEDTVLVPGQTISAGVCLESFVVATTDSNFVPQFVDRTGTQRWSTRVHKLARVTGFSVYWRVADKERYELIPPALRSAALRRFVAEQAATPTGETGGGLERGYLIRPIGAVLKLIHCDHADDKMGPKFEASFEMDDVKMDFRAEQYEQALSLKDSITALANWQIFFPFRPKTSPFQDPKAWWRCEQ